MAFAQGPSIRNTVHFCISPLRCQRRWARVHDVRFVTTDQVSHRILDKYKEKLAQKAKEEGHDSISALKEAYKDKISDYRKTSQSLPNSTKTSFQQKPPPPPAPQSPSQFTSHPSPSASQSASAMPGIKPLSSYLDLTKVSALPNKELEYIWRLRHASDPLSLCAVIPLETYNRIHRTARAHPQFILPLPRSIIETNDEGTKQTNKGAENANKTAAEIHFLQWSFHPPVAPSLNSGLQTANTHTSTVLFTHLASYKLHGEFAPPHTTITHHLDLADSHGLVLLNGSVVEGKGVSVEEGRWLLMCLQKFYDFEGHGGGIGKEKRQGLLEKFSRGDQGFKIEELVDEAERVS